MFYYTVMHIEVDGTIQQTVKKLWYSFDQAMEYKKTVHADLRPFLVTIPDTTAQLLYNAFGWRVIA